MYIMYIPVYSCTDHVTPSQVLDKTWHSECLVCVDCGAALADQCFTRNGKFYCSKDFERLV